MELYARVRRAVHVEGRSQREVAREFGLARKTVRKMLAYPAPPGYQRQKPSPGASLAHDLDDLVEVFFRIALPDLHFAFDNHVVWRVDVLVERLTSTSRKVLSMASRVASTASGSSRLARLRSDPTVSTAGDIGGLFLAL